MMKESFGKLFWGFFLVLIEIHLIVVDVLPDPLGYLFIYMGVHSLGKNMSASTKAEYLSLALLFLSIPTLFIQNQQLNEFAYGMTLNGWSIYLIIIGFLKLILVFYVLKVMVAIAQERGEVALFKRTNSVFRIYMIVMLISSLSHSFFMNMTNNFLVPFMIFMMISSLIMEITFLVLIRRFKKIEDAPPENNPIIEGR
jgi:hypothetical protein